LRGEIQRLARQAGHSIGAHSVHHLMLPLQSKNEQEREIVECKRTLDGILPQPASLFSYPYGGFDLTTLDFVRTAGFRAAVTTEGFAVSGSADVYALPRLDVKRGGVPSLVHTLDQAFASQRDGSGTQSQVCLGNSQSASI